MNTLQSIEKHLTKIEDENSEFPLPRSLVLNGLQAEGRKLKEGDKYNDLLDRLTDEGMMETIKQTAQNTKWQRTDYGNEILRFLNNSQSII